jgi:hypothetical protein
MNQHPHISVEPATQLALFLSNRPGALAKVCEELAKAEINIHALSISDTVDHSIVRMVVSDTTKALMLLGEGGMIALEAEVLMTSDNNPARSQRLLNTSQRRGVNVVCIFAKRSLKDRAYDFAPVEHIRAACLRRARLNPDFSASRVLNAGEPEKDRATERTPPSPEQVFTTKLAPMFKKPLDS